MGSLAATRQMLAILCLAVLLLLITSPAWFSFIKGNGGSGGLPTFKGESTPGSPLSVVDRMEQVYYHMLQRNYFIRSHSATLSPSFRLAISKIRNAVMAKQAKQQVNLTDQERPTCPEAYHGAKSDYPDYLTNWKFSQCPNEKPLPTLITICIIASEFSSKNDILHTIEVINKKYKNMPIIIAAKSSELDDVEKKHPQVTVISGIKQQNTLGVWNSLIKAVKTPYVFLGRGFNRLGHYTNLTRAVHVLSEIPAVGVVSFGNLNKDRIWNIDCFHVTLKNYEMRIIEGYQRSFNECTVCGYANGPFMMKSSTLKKYELDVNLVEEDLGFLDLFLRLKKEELLVVSCPDIMTLMSRSKTVLSFSKDNWLPFVQKWEVNELQKADMPTIQFSCKDCKIVCNLQQIIAQGLITPICCRRAQARMVRDFIEFCEKHKLHCELDTGTALGAVKFNHVLPWAFDADVAIHKDNISTLIQYKSELEQKGYVLNVKSDKSLVTFTYKAPELKGLFMECWTKSPYISIGNVHTGVYKPTRILFDNHLVNVPYNPGLYARNRYGREIFKHSPGWKAFNRKHSMEDYYGGYVIPCKKPDHHACMDKSARDGNIKLVYRRK